GYRSLPDQRICPHVVSSIASGEGAQPARNGRASPEWQKTKLLEYFEKPMKTILAFITLSVCGFGIERPGVEYKIFQFPADKIPRIDGDPSDWSIVPESYSIGMDQLKETNKGRGFNYDKKDLDVKVKVGWVKGLDRLYFLYEAFDNYWDFDGHSRHNDIFEVVVDGDHSGGPLVTSLHPHTKLAGADAFFQFQGVHDQNYHIFTPAP